MPYCPIIFKWLSYSEFSILDLTLYIAQPQVIYFSIQTDIVISKVPNDFGPSFQQPESLEWCNNSLKAKVGWILNWASSLNRVELQKFKLGSKFYSGLILSSSLVWSSDQIFQAEQASFRLAQLNWHSYRWWWLLVHFCWRWLLVRYYQCSKTRPVRVPRR